MASTQPLFAMRSAHQPPGEKGFSKMSLALEMHAVKRNIVLKS
jgi:hypothetical protein